MTLSSAADDVDIGALTSLSDGRFRIHRCGDIHAVLLDSQSERLAFRWTREEPGSLVLVASKPFFLEKALFFGDVNGDPVAYMVVTVTLAMRSG
jgi:hypothetical protein